MSDIKAERKVVGTKQAKRAVISDEVKCIYIAKDAEKHIINELVQMCNERNIRVIYVSTMKELGEACGIDVSAASVAILN